MPRWPLRLARFTYLSNGMLPMAPLLAGLFYGLGFFGLTTRRFILVRFD